MEVQAGSGYTVGDPASATVTVNDADEGLPTPANLMAEAGAGAGEVALSWDVYAPHLQFPRHQYRYKTDGNYAAWTDIPNSGQLPDGNGSNLTGYTVTGLVGGQSHTFQVRTHHLKPDGITLVVSGSSNEATATPRSAADTDTTAPTLISASVGRSGGTTTLRFSEDLPLTVGEALSATAQGAFSRTVNGVAQNIADIRRDFLTTTALVVYHTRIYIGQTVVVSYDQSAAGADAIADAAGNEVVDFTTGSGGVPAVTNSSTQVAPSTDATDATLSALTVTGGGSNLVTFVSGTTTYTAMVANAVAAVTVTPTKNNTGATIEYLDGDDATLDDAGTVAGHQVAVAEGARPSSR